MNQGPYLVVLLAFVILFIAFMNQRQELKEIKYMVEEVVCTALEQEQDGLGF